MLRQLRNLLRPVGDPSKGRLSVAIYSTPDGMPPGNESGYEGVTCVDDAARAAILYARVWHERRSAWAREILLGLLRFVLSMQQPSGRFVNFALDWTGQRNYDGPTSREGSREWSARAVLALVAAWDALDSPEDAHWRGVLAQALVRAWPAFVEEEAANDMRAMHLQAGLQMRKSELRDILGTGGDHLLESWAEQIAASRIGPVIINYPDEATIEDVHLWGHIQEGVLAQAAIVLECPEWLSIAENSASALLEPLVTNAFPRTGLCPFDISATIRSLEWLADTTSQRKWIELVALARKWFDGRNPAHRPVYDRVLGKVHDGIDHGELNPNSGAESNIEAGLALFDELEWSAIEADMRQRGSGAIAAS